MTTEKWRFFFILYFKIEIARLDWSSFLNILQELFDIFAVNTLITMIFFPNP